jgi:hypothetical protein
MRALNSSIELILEYTTTYLSSPLKGKLKNI